MTTGLNKDRYTYFVSGSVAYQYYNDKITNSAKIFGYTKLDNNHWVLFSENYVAGRLSESQFKNFVKTLLAP